MIGRVGVRKFETEYALGQEVCLCGDKSFRAVVKAIELRLGSSPSYLLRWRDRFDFTETWMSAEEIEALAILEE